MAVWWWMNVTQNLVLRNHNVSPCEHFSLYRRLAILCKQSMADQNAEERISGWDQHAIIRILGWTNWSGKNLRLFTIEGSLFCQKFHFCSKFLFQTSDQILQKKMSAFHGWAGSSPGVHAWARKVVDIVLLTLSGATGLLFADISEKTV